MRGKTCRFLLFLSLLMLSLGRQAIADPVLGKMEPVFDWPLVAVSMAHLPDGRILTFSGSERRTWPTTERTYSAVWDPETGLFEEYLHDGHNMFCGALSLTEDGGVFVTGGRNQGNSPWVSLYSPVDNTWLSLDNMASGGRWYPTTLALGDGSIMTAMGHSTNVRNPDLWNRKTGWKVLSGIDFLSMRQGHNELGRANVFPLLSLMPDGNVFHFWDSDESHRVSASGAGSAQPAHSVSDNDAHQGGGQLVYDIGKLLITGRNDGSWGNDRGDVSDTAFTVDLNGAEPVIQSTSNMLWPRKFHQLLPLPTGEALVIGGNSSGVKFSDYQSVLPGEIWNPDSGQWRATAPLTIPRDYHSTALLMTDGRVLTAGGGYHPGDATSPGTHQDAQIFKPPYLFAADGSEANRPTLSSSVTEIETGQTLDVETTGDIAYFSFIRMSSTTHALNTDSRFYRPDFESVGGGIYSVSIHQNPNVALPGYWMLFAVDTAGVPSVAHVVRVGDVTLDKKNLSLFGNATQSSVWQSDSILFGASNAIDGNAAADVSAGTTAVTQTELSPWWELDLNRLADVDELRIWLPSGCCADNAFVHSVFVSSQPLQSSDIVSLRSQPGVSEFTFTPDKNRHHDILIDETIRYVRIQIEGDARLQLADVQALGDPPALSNVALSGTVVQSSTLTSTLNSEDNFRAEKAIDSDNTGTAYAEIPALGGNGGAAFQLACPDGEVLAGVFGTADASRIMSIGARCVSVDDSGTWQGSPVDNASTGSTSLGVAFSGDCPTDNVVTGFSGHSDQYVNAVALHCQPLVGEAAAAGSETMVGPFGSSEGTARDTVYCNGIAVGLAGRSGTLIDRAGLSCSQSDGSISATEVEAQPWWEIDLGEPTEIDSLVIWNRKDCCSDNLANLHIMVSDTPFESADLATARSQSGVDDFFQPGILARHTEVLIARQARYIRLQLEGTASLALAEVEINGTSVIPLSVADVSAIPAETGSVINFTGSAAGNGLTYSWSFGDGSTTGFSTDVDASHTYVQPGRYTATLTVRDQHGQEASDSFIQIVHEPLVSGSASQSSTLLEHSTEGTLWVVNPDNHSVTVLDGGDYSVKASISVGAHPQSIAEAPDGSVWVVNKEDANISVISSSNHVVEDTIELTRASQPHGLVFSDTSAFVVLEATGRVVKLDAVTGNEQGSLDVGPRPRHISINHDSSRLYVSRFITPHLPGEDSATPVVDDGTNLYGGELLVLDDDLTPLDTVILAHGDRVVSEHSGPGIPNYLGPALLSPDGKSAWVPSKQDNILAGTLRGGDGITFDQTVRAISSVIDLDSGAEMTHRRIDHDNASVAGHATFDAYGSLMFTSLEGNRQIAISDVHTDTEIARFDTGLAPQSVLLSHSGARLFVHNYMSRSVGVYDISAIVHEGAIDAGEIAEVSTVAADRLNPQVLLGKQLFHDARDDRLAALDYMSCASCHADGGHDGRTWDFTSLGEGLRNTVSLIGRGGMANGLLHWTGNFDELQDFEGQIREFAGGTGLMTTSDFNAASDPLGNPKAGASTDLDALAAYMNSLVDVEASPHKPADGAYSVAAESGVALFTSKGCAACHSDQALSDSASGLLHDIGTLTAASGKRLGGTLAGMDTPGLLGVWNTAPYLHDGSAPDLESAIRAHSDIAMTDAEVADLVALLTELDDVVQFLELEDSDADGVPDTDDEFPNDANEWQDSDGDGVGDNSDVFVADASEWLDSDGDGTGDNADVFPDDAEEQSDSDGDGIGDNGDAFPNNADEWQDSNGNGLGDNSEAGYAMLSTGSSVVREARGEAWEFFLLDYENTGTVDIRLSDLSHDNDLYIAIGSEPTLDNWYCRSWRGSTQDDSCEVVLTSADQLVYIGVHGVPDSTYTLSASRPRQDAVAAEEVITLATGGSHSGNLAEDEWIYFRVDNTLGLSDLQVVLDQLSEDLDLYVQLNALPTRQLFTCRSYFLQASTETCDIDLSDGNTAYIGVYGFAASPYRLSAGVPEATEPPAITSIVPGESDNQMLSQSEYNFYQIDNPNQRELTLATLSSLTADIDLYTRAGSLPSVQSYDCGSSLSGTRQESCLALLQEGNGPVYIGVRGYEAGLYQLTLSDTELGVGINHQEISPGDALEGSLEADSWLYYQVTNSADLIAIQATLSDLTADVDLYVRTSALPTQQDFDCQSDAQGMESEQCALDILNNKPMIIGVHAWETANFTLSLTGDALSLGAAVDDQEPGIRVQERAKVYAGKWNFYEINTGANEETLEVSLDDNEISAWLYVQKNSRPTDNDYTCGPGNYTNKENVCIVELTGDDTWYVGVNTWYGTSYNILSRTTGQVSNTNSADNPEEQTIEEPVTDTTGDVAQVPARPGITTGSGAASPWLLLLLFIVMLVQRRSLLLTFTIVQMMRFSHARLLCREVRY